MPPAFVVADPKLLAPFQVQNYPAFWQKYIDVFSLSLEQTVYFNSTFWTHALPIGAVTLYVIMLLFLPKLVIMIKGEQKEEKKRAKGSKAKVVSFFKLSFFDKVRFLWNLHLTIMSVFFFIGILVPMATTFLPKMGLKGVICDPDYIMTSIPTTMALWCHLFSIYKYVELFDTFFLIVNKPKRPILFLHWYHHITVLVFGWYGPYYQISMGYMFALVNAFVHCVMYFYYALVILGYRPSWGKKITVIQISQMVIGLALTGSWVYFRQNGDNCSCTKPFEVISYAGIMYFTYFLLFVKFFINRWIRGSKKSKKDKKE